MNMEVKNIPCCSECGASRKPSELNGAQLTNDGWDYSRAYCVRIAQCDSAQASSQIDSLLEDLSDIDSVSPPIPQQDELLPVSSSVALAEYQQAFKNESAHLPETALRYLIWLIVSENSMEDIKLFANQMRIELNAQRLEKLKASIIKINK